MNAQQVKAVFDGIPAEALLGTARSMQGKLASDPSLVREKSAGQLVTEADLALQSQVLEYFEQSPLRGTYAVKAEEEAGQSATAGAPLWQLIVDPLDGTDSFVRGESDWGIMVGMADAQGKLLYSWNVLADGSRYCSGSAAEQSLLSLSKRLVAKGKLKFDVYDYGATAASRFARTLGESNSGAFPTTSIETTSYAAAVVAGRALAEDNLDGLLWLPSTKGKTNYPDYDLVFLGALQARGWKVVLGKSGDEVVLVAVAPTLPDLNILCQTGLRLLTPAERSQIALEPELKITSAITKRGSAT